MCGYWLVDPAALTAVLTDISITVHESLVLQFPAKVCVPEAATVNPPTVPPKSITCLELAGVVNVTVKSLIVVQ